jgi:predicted MPP superfamily phosphohydrolase
MSRREFLGAVAAATPPAVTVVATGFSVPHLDEFRVRPMTIPLPTLPPALDGLTIAHVTDVHVGRFTSGPVLRKIIDATNNLRADLVLMTGDLINHAIADLPAALDMVKQLDARHGVWMCEGNHDLIESRTEFERIVKASTVPLLINEKSDLQIRNQHVQLLGLRWGSADRNAPRSKHRSDDAIRNSMNAVLPLRDADAFPILLAHHPHAFDPAAEAGIPLTLAGHTHGGQLMLTPNLGFGPWMFRYWSGLYQRGNSALVVSNGVGNWFPLRTNAPAEIIHITLKRARET